VRLQLSFAAAILYVASAALPHAGAQDAASARSLLKSVYKHYENGGSGIDLTGPKAKQFFDASLLGLIRKDQKAAAPDVGVLDGDPICGCQDWDGIWDLKIVIRKESNSRANATVSFALFKDQTSRDRRSLEIALTSESGQWRIFDIVDNADPKGPFALRAALKKDIESMAHKTERNHVP
jgi:Protein of unknown function (DUF3828)